MARAAGSVDGVRIIVTLAAEGGGGGGERIARAVPPPCGRRSRAERGMQAGGRRPEVSASERASKQAGGQAGEREVRASG